MKKILLTFLATFILTGVFAAKRKVELVFSQEEVYVTLDNNLLGMNPAAIKVDFELGGVLSFFKKGYLSQSVEIDPSTVFNKLKIDLIKREKSVEASAPRLLKFDQFKSTQIVTNLSTEDIRAGLENYFVKCNYNIGINSPRFPNGEADAQNSKYTLNAELVAKEQISSVYKSPKFMLARATFRWSITDNETGKVVLFKEIEGMYFVRMSTMRGIIVSDRMVQVTKEAMEESQHKLMMDEDFLALFN